MRQTIAMVNVVITAVVCLIMFSCSKDYGDLADAMALAEDNKAELEKVLNHYEQQQDTLKLKLARFLIGNMDGHSYVTYHVIDTNDAEIEFDPLVYEDYSSLQEGWDDMETEHGTLDFERNVKTEDLKTVTADYLIENIDWAVRAWKEKPWASSLSYDDFCNYVLPYRGSNEPIESWREIMWQRYEGIETKMENPSDAIEATSIINDEIKSWFKFDERYYYHPTDQGVAEMMSKKMGRCEDMTNLTIYAMRANGLAVTSDYTPYWADAGNNHAWNAIVSPDGQVIPFMGAERNPGKYKLWHRMAKVYRKTYAMQHDNLIFQKDENEKVPRWLAGKNYVDVTKDYTDVSDVTIKIECPIPDTIHYAYLCVFNSGEFKAIHWSRIEAGAASFTDMGRDIVYLPALYVDEEIVPAGAPFIFEKDGSIRQLSCNPDIQSAISLVSTTQATIEYSTEGIVKSRLAIDKEYELFYWRDDWQSVGKAVATDKPLTFENVPTGCLYWLVETDSRKEERIFTIEDGQQVWW